MTPFLNGGCLIEIKIHVSIRLYRFSVYTVLETESDMRYTRIWYAFSTSEGNFVYSSLLENESKSLMLYYQIEKCHSPDVIKDFVY